MIAPGFGGINLEDIAAPRCFEIERRLRESLDIPVFHDDQHGTAIVVLAALTNALRVVGKKLADVRVVVSGAGAAGTAIVKLLLAAGRRTDVVVGDRTASSTATAPTCDARLAAGSPSNTNPRRAHAAPARGAARRRRVHRRQRAGHADRRVDRRHGRRTRWSSRWPTPTRRSTRPRPQVRRRGGERAQSDYPNQINNVLAFPGRLPRAARRAART